MKGTLTRNAGTILVALAVAMAFTVAGSTTALASGNHGDNGNNAGGADKVTICHVPPGNPANAQVITVGEPAADSHLSNHEGDFVIEDYHDKKKCLNMGDDHEKKDKKDHKKDKKHKKHKKH